MSIKQTLIMGAVGAVGIVAARRVSASTIDGTGSGASSGQMLPFVPEIMPKNGWSFAFVAIPALGAWYLSR